MKNRWSKILRTLAVGAIFVLPLAGCDGCDAGGGVTSSGGRILFTPDPADFGYVIVGQSKELQVTVKNSGRGTLRVRSIDRGDGFPGDVLYSPPRMQLEPGEEQTLTLIFQPKAEGLQEGKLLLRNDGAEDPVELDVRGVGIITNLVFEPASVDFGPVILDESADRGAVLRNSGAYPVDVFVDEMAGDNPDVFKVALPGQDQTHRTLAAGETIDLAVTFHPSAIGTMSARFVVRPCAGCSPTELPLMGRGVAAGIITDPEVLDFGSVLPNTTSTKPLLFKNVGNRTIAITGIKAAQNGTEFDFIPPGSWPVLEPRAEINIDFVYRPLNSGSDTTRFIVSTDDQRAPSFEVVVKGYGGGPIIEVTPGALEFNSVAIGYPVKRRLVITNKGVNDANSNADDLVISSIDALTGPFAWALASGTTLPLTIAPGTRQIIDVTYSPLAVATGAGDSDSIKIHSNDGDRPTVAVPLHGKGVNAPPCVYDLVPAASPGLQFGVVQRGRSARLSFVIKNTSQTGDNCLIGGIEVDPASNGVFTLPNGAVFGQLLAAGQSLVTEVEFTPPGTAPSGTNYTGTVDVTVAANQPFDHQQIQLSGRGAEVCLSITPTGVDFGTVSPSCQTNARNFAIYNACATSVQIDDISVVQQAAPSPFPDAFSLDKPALPVTIAPGGQLGTSIANWSAASSYKANDIVKYNNATYVAVASSKGVTPGTAAASGSWQLYMAQLKFNVYYRPWAERKDFGTVEVRTNQAITGNPPQPYVLTLQGEGKTGASASETFIQADRAEADILFVVDDSGSMMEEQQSLASNFSSFMNFAISQGVDYRIAVTTTDTALGSGCGNVNGRFVPTVGANRIVTNTLPNPSAQFSQNVNVGTNGCSEEMGLEAAYRALTDPNINGSNSNFLRSSAYLSIIIISDEEDQSPSPVDFYANFFQNIKGPRGANLVSVSTITGLNPVASSGGWTSTPSCTGPGGESDYGSRYIAVAQRTGGLTEDICSANWSVGLQKLGLIAFGYKSRFILKSEPDPVSISVKVDGNAVGKTKWSYDPDLNSVDFDPTAVPSAGSVIEVSYDVACHP